MPVRRKKATRPCMLRLIRRIGARAAERRRRRSVLFVSVFVSSPPLAPPSEASWRLHGSIPGMGSALSRPRRVVFLGAVIGGSHLLPNHLVPVPRVALAPASARSHLTPRGAPIPSRRGSGVHAAKAASEAPQPWRLGKQAALEQLGEGQGRATRARAGAGARARPESEAIPARLPLQAPRREEEKEASDREPARARARPRCRQRGYADRGLRCRHRRPRCAQQDAVRALHDSGGSTQALRRAGRRVPRASSTRRGAPRRAARSLSFRPHPLPPR
jgi:hypothetical protein